MTNQERHALQAETLRKLTTEGLVDPKTGKTIKMNIKSRDNHGNQLGTLINVLERSVKS